MINQFLLKQLVAIETVDNPLGVQVFTLIHSIFKWYPEFKIDNKFAEALACFFTSKLANNATIMTVPIILERVIHNYPMPAVYNAYYACYRLMIEKNDKNSVFYGNFLNCFDYQKVIQWKLQDLLANLCSKYTRTRIHVCNCTARERDSSSGEQSCSTGNRPRRASGMRDK